MVSQLVVSLYVWKREVVLYFITPAVCPHLGLGATPAVWTTDHARVSGSKLQVTKGKKMH
jgi:hypothetical protein